MTESGKTHAGFGPLSQLRIHHVRNIIQAELTGLSQLNVIYGANGSGKSSVLEAIDLLLTGRSFRTGQPRQAIQHGSTACQVFAVGSEQRLGMQRQQDGEVTFRLDGQTVATLGEISRLLPVQVISPEGMDLIDGGSKGRRQLLDWLCFHIQPAFYPVWLRYQRALRQRNLLLKRVPLSQLSQAEIAHQFAAWEQELAQAGEQIDRYRLDSIDRWQTVFDEVWASLCPELAVQLRYQAGFDGELGLTSVLAQGRLRDHERGHTQSGGHRADLRLKGELGLVAQTFSRGQKKLLIFALRVSQVVLLARETCASVVLLDDLTAELDSDAQYRVLQWLQQGRAQVFLTLLNPALLPAGVAGLLQSACWFYADAGQISLQSDQVSLSC